MTVDKHIGKTQSLRKFNKFSISQFAINLSYENWDNILWRMILIQFLTTFSIHTREFSTPASRYRKYTAHIITNSGLQQEYKHHTSIEENFI